MNIIICNEVIIVKPVKVLPFISPAVSLIKNLSVDLFDLTGRSVCRSS